VIYDAAFFGFLEANVDALLDRTPEVLRYCIQRCLEIKNTIVEQDQYESGIRSILNFGHTIGHALEQCLEYAVPHGIAVAKGMQMEASIAVALDILPAEDAARLHVLIDNFALLDDYDFNVSEEAMFEVMRLDKKADADAIRCVLLSGIGAVYAEGGYTHLI